MTSKDDLTRRIERLEDDEDDDGSDTLAEAIKKVYDEENDL